MKRDAFDVFKGIVLLIITSLMVMAYTTIEKSVVVAPGNGNTVSPGIAPVATELIDKSKNVKADQTTTKDNYSTIKYGWPGIQGIDKNSYTTRTILLLL